MNKEQNTAITKTQIIKAMCVLCLFLSAIFLFSYTLIFVLDWKARIIFATLLAILAIIYCCKRVAEVLFNLARHLMRNGDEVEK